MRSVKDGNSPSCNTSACVVNVCIAATFEAQTASAICVAASLFNFGHSKMASRRGPNQSLEYEHMIRENINCKPSPSGTANILPRPSASVRRRPRLPRLRRWQRRPESRLLPRRRAELRPTPIPGMFKIRHMRRPSASAMGRPLQRQVRLTAARRNPALTPALG